MAARKRGNARKSAKKSSTRSQTTRVAAGKGRKIASTKPAKRPSAAKRTRTTAPLRRRANDVTGPHVDDVNANGIRR